MRASAPAATIVTDAGTSRSGHLGAQRARARIVGIADDHDLDRRTHVTLERAEQVREAGRV